MGLDPSASHPSAVSGREDASVEVEGLAFAHPRGGHRLDAISLVVKQGELCCLLGPNGAGKTTLLRCLLGLLPPQSGAVRIARHDVARLSRRALARLVAYVPQAAPTTFPFTTLEIALTGRTPHIGVTAMPSATDRLLAQATLDELGIGHLAQRPFSSLSGGERQLALLGRALVQEAPILILDEPTAALDYGNELRILRTVADLAAAGRAVLMTTHQPNHALAYAGHAVLLANGRVVADGAPPDVVTSRQLSDLYGVPIRVVLVAGPSGGDRGLRICVPTLGPTTPPRTRNQPHDPESATR